MPRATLRSLAFAVTVGLGVTAAAAAGPFDGTYRGNQTTLRTNSSPDCASTNRTGVAIVIRDSHFNRRWGNGEMSVNVAPDGTFHAEAPVQNSRNAHFASITGKITGGNLEADIGTNFCASHLSLKKS
jgi:hypothetical protein